MATISTKTKKIRGNKNRTSQEAYLKVHSVALGKAGLDENSKVSNLVGYLVNENKEGGDVTHLITDQER